MPGTDLLLFAELQRQRLQAALISTSPRQTFTAGPRAEVYTLTPAHRREYSTRVTPEPVTPYTYTLHGTQAMYSQCGCRCEPCTSANSTYRRMLRTRQEAKQRIPAEHGTTTRYGRGCRCEACGYANWDYGRRWRAARRRAGAT